MTLRFLAPLPASYDSSVLPSLVPDAEAFNIVDLGHPEADEAGHGEQLAVYVPDDSTLTEAVWRGIVSQLPPAPEPEDEPDDGGGDG